MKGASVLLAAVLLAGCRTPAPGGSAGRPLLPPPIDGPAAALPSYAEVVARYNAAAAVGLERFSARVGVEIAYAEVDGAARTESGAGRLLHRRPLDTALSVDVVGNTILWAGSNQRRWWVFSELHKRGRLTDGPLSGDAGPDVSGLPFRPDAVPLVLGLRRLDPSPAGSRPRVEGLNGFWLIEPPGLGARFLLDPRTARPVRVDLLGPDGRTRVVCRLDGEVSVDGLRPDVTLPVLIDAYPVEQGGNRLTLTLRSATADDRVLKDDLFDLDFLIGYHRPAEREHLGDPPPAR